MGPNKVIRWQFGEFLGLVLLAVFLLCACVVD